MPNRKRSWWHQALKQFRNRFKATHFGKPYHSRSVATPRSAKLRGFNRVWNHREHFLLWIRGRQRQHFGPESRVLDLFQRRDHAYFSLEAQKLQWRTPPPIFYHNLLDAAAKVGLVEERIGYTFKDKMTCIEALKVSGDDSPLYFKGVRHEMGRNSRLALLGDRILSLALCEIWFSTGRSRVDYNQIRVDVETRYALNLKGRALELHKSIIVANTSWGPSHDNIAETFEAILGAIYIDSGYKVQTVKDVIRKMGLDNHKFLRMSEGTVTESKLQKDLHTLDTKRPLARQPDDELTTQSKTTAKANIRPTDSKSNSLISESLRKWAILWAGPFNSSAKSTSQKYIASSSSLPVREGVEVTPANKLFNDTKPVSDEWPKNVTQSSVTTSKSVPDPQADVDIKLKISTEAESQGAAPPQQVTTAESEKPTAVGNKDADPLQAAFNKTDGERAIWLKANQDAMVKAKEMVERMKKNGAKVNFDDIYPRIWKKMQPMIVQKVKEDRIRREVKEKKERLALEAQKKADEVYAKQKAAEASAKQKMVEASAMQVKVNGTSKTQKKNVSESSVTQKKAKDSSKPPKKANESSNMHVKACEESAAEKKENEASAEQKKAKEASTAQKKTKDAPKTQKKLDDASPARKKQVVGTSTMQKNLEKASTNEEQTNKFYDTQKMIEEASPTQNRTGGASIGKERMDVLELPRETKAALVEPDIRKSSTDFVCDGYERQAAAISEILERLGDEISELAKNNPKQPQSETLGPLVLNPEPESCDTEHNCEPKLEDTTANIAEEDDNVMQEVPHLAIKSRIQMELGNPPLQVDAESVIVEPEAESSVAHLAENKESKPHEPVVIDPEVENPIAGFAENDNDFKMNKPVHMAGD